MTHEDVSEPDGLLAIRSIRLAALAGTLLVLGFLAETRGLPAGL